MKEKQIRKHINAVKGEGPKKTKTKTNTKKKDTMPVSDIPLLESIKDQVSKPTPKPVSEPIPEPAPMPTPIRNTNIDEPDNAGRTKLMYAANEGRIKDVKLLIEKGADVNLGQTNGETALMEAAERGYTDICKLLIENGAEINAVSIFEDTALMKAVEGKQTETVKYLLSVFANPLIKECGGKTAYNIAVALSIKKEKEWWETEIDPEIIQTLKKYTARWEKVGGGRVREIHRYTKKCLPNAVRITFLYL